MTAAISLIIAGSRGLSPTVEEIDTAVCDACGLWPFRLADIGEVVSGAARGVDVCGERWAHVAGIAIHREPLDRYSSWSRATATRAGLQAQHQRMADRADALLACWDGFDHATSDLVCRMVALGKLVHVVTRGAR
jgi:hypothetical protein